MINTTVDPMIRLGTDQSDLHNPNLSPIDWQSPLGGETGTVRVGNVILCMTRIIRVEITTWCGRPHQPYNLTDIPVDTTILVGALKLIVCFHSVYWKVCMIGRLYQFFWLSLPQCAQQHWRKISHFKV
jgi:hypothetical protein